MANENEASVEEILESIKKVIARDGDNTAPRMRRKAEQVSEKIAETESDATHSNTDESVLDLTEMELSQVVELEEEDEGDADSLLTDKARGAMQDNLAALAMLAEPGAKPQIVRSGETSLEGLTRELLRPMLAEWLDKNLPNMVERLVQKEISRIAGKRD